MDFGRNIKKYIYILTKTRKQQEYIMKCKKDMEIYGTIRKEIYKTIFKHKPKKMKLSKKKF